VGLALVLSIGDSLAQGTPLARYVHERVVTRAERGIGTHAGVHRFLHPLGHARVVVVSLGSNDTNPRVVEAQARHVKRVVKKRCLLWVRVAGVPPAAEINRALKRAGVHLVRWHSSVLHPSPAGYSRRARLIARTIKEEC
jgi:lysophospholipase L1-like esterase